MGSLMTAKQSVSGDWELGAGAANPGAGALGVGRPMVEGWILSRSACTLISTLFMDVTRLGFALLLGTCISALPSILLPATSVTLSEVDTTMLISNAPAQGTQNTVSR